MPLNANWNVYKPPGRTKDIIQDLFFPCLISLLTKLQCCTLSGTVVGFSSATYTGTETSGNVAVCIQILNPPFGGATKQFDAILLPAQS